MFCAESQMNDDAKSAAVPATQPNLRRSSRKKERFGVPVDNRVIYTDSRPVYKSDEQRSLKRQRSRSATGQSRSPSSKKRRVDPTLLHIDIENVENHPSQTSPLVAENEQLRQENASLTAEIAALQRTHTKPRKTHTSGHSRSPKRTNTSGPSKRSAIKSRAMRMMCCCNR